MSSEKKIPRNTTAKLKPRECMRPHKMQLENRKNLLEKDQLGYIRVHL